MRFKMMGGTEMGSANVDAASVKNLSVKWASGAVNIDVVDEAMPSSLSRRRRAA